MVVKVTKMKTIKDLLQKEGIRALYIDTDTTLYFQYGRSYRVVKENIGERLDHRVVIVIEEDIEVLFKLDGDGRWEYRHFNTLTAALKWIEREVK